YRGRPLTRRSVEHSGRLPEVVVIYQHNIERICHTAQQVIQQVRRTVLHEVGHHFGLDERQLRQLGY
ncbi:MAG: metallopeptidase family protein, partial [Phycisphaerae bacterium]